MKRAKHSQNRTWSYLMRAGSDNLAHLETDPVALKMPAPGITQDVVFLHGSIATRTGHEGSSIVYASLDHLKKDLTDI